MLQSVHLQLPERLARARDPSWAEPERLAGAPTWAEPEGLAGAPPWAEPEGLAGAPPWAQGVSSAAAPPAAGQLHPLHQFVLSGAALQAVVSKHFLKMCRRDVPAGILLQLPELGAAQALASLRPDGLLRSGSE